MPEIEPQLPNPNERLKLENKIRLAFETLDSVRDIITFGSDPTAMKAAILDLIDSTLEELAD